MKAREQTRCPKGVHVEERSRLRAKPWDTLRGERATKETEKKWLQIKGKTGERVQYPENQVKNVLEGRGSVNLPSSPVREGLKIGSW